VKVICGINKIQKFKKPVVALGVFDGVHRAHRRILRAAAQEAQRIKGTSVVLTFWPHPQNKSILYSLEHRLRLISEVKIDVCIVIKFNKSFARVSAEDFIKDILINKLGANYICVGKNFRFGKCAGGDYKMLRGLSRIYNYRLKVFGIIRINNQPISSTYIRRLITTGQLTNAQKLLARPVSILGTVIKGTGWGRRLGFPTANIDPHNEVIPPAGVYAVKIFYHNKKFKGITYIGGKPTFLRKKIKIKSQKLENIEVYIFNFKKNIYGENLEVQFINKIRDEKKFTNSLPLVRQIKKDITLAKMIFSLHN